MVFADAEYKRHTDLFRRRCVFRAEPSTGDSGI